ncbi:MAG: ERF family protein [Thermodesulfobacteriota bacterium]|nr:ERF family protein [Thermodesulfobacteriota bacterium]
MTEKQKPFEVKVVDKRFKENEIVPASQTDLIMTAIQRGFEPEFIEKMMGLQERFEANEAKKAYHKAMAAFKANPPKVWRDMQVKYGSGANATNWSHADLGVAAEAINRTLGENGLNATWRTLPLENDLTRVTCIITHEFGHSEETHLEAGPDKSGSKNAIQAIGSTVFYLERYTLFALTGLAPARMDDDGVSTGAEYISEKQLSSLTDMINAKEVDESKFLKYIGVESLEMLPAKDFNKAMIALKKKPAPQREPGQEG